MAEYDLLFRAGRVFCAESGLDGSGAVAVVGDRIVAAALRWTAQRRKTWIFPTICCCRGWWICTPIRRAAIRAAGGGAGRRQYGCPVANIRGRWCALSASGNRRDWAPRRALDEPAGGWLVFAVPHGALARGENLLGIGALGRELRVEKVEVRVCCTEVL